MTCSLTLTANAGVILSVGNKEILIDALHNKKVRSFSTVPRDIIAAVRNRYAVCSPSMFLATHIHADHISAELWDDARRRWPECVFISPAPPLDGTIVLKPPHQSFAVDGIKVNAVRLMHEGIDFESVVNFGYFLEIDGFTVLIPGDCALKATKELTELIAGRRVDLALLNFPWITLSKPRKFVLETIAPSHIVMFHLPFENDDLMGYQAAAVKAAQNLPPLDVRLLSKPFEELVITAP